LSW
jgi:3-isopropylmalate/(R)-2-methylmalate dehydratase small subunit